MASSLTERMLKAGNIKSASTLSMSKFFNTKDPILTEVPIINVAFSGHLDGGLIPGLTVIAGASKSFKTLLSLYCMKAYLKKYPEGIAILYDSEFGITPEYLSGIGIDLDRVLHIPIANIEELKFDIVSRLQEIEKNDKVFIMIDSVGNLASKKEVEDAENEKSVADMTRAKSLKSLFRIVTPILTIKNIPMLAINHIYMTQEMFSKPVVSGGCVEEGTMIQVLNGAQAIEEIVKGTIVPTMAGNKLVTETWTPDTLEFGEVDCYELEFEDGFKVVVSGQHPFLTENGWVDAEDMREGDVALKL